MRVLAPTGCPPLAGLVGGVAWKLTSGFRPSSVMENVRSLNHRGAAMEGVKLASKAAAKTNRTALRDKKNILDAPHQPQAIRKRGLQEKPAAAGAKSQPGAVDHRPVTRKFAAIVQQSQPANAPLVWEIKILAVLILSWV
ncbi:hypothetical protein ZWY2020_007207 [Hordeum vulgare]|nr:hypothetical protein ZWY2020_007207 [Hordeum vulgare]